MTEKSIQSAIVDWLRLRGRLVFEFGKPGGHRELRGSLPVGFPDLLTIRDGWYVFLEVKAPGGRLSQAQRALHAEMRGAGCHVYVVRSLEDVWELYGNEW